MKLNAFEFLNAFRNHASRATVVDYAYAPAIYIILWNIPVDIL